MKKIYLTERQYRRLNEEIDLEKKTFSPSILGEIEDSDFDIMDAKILNRILNERYQEVLKCFSDDITKVPLENVKNKYNKLLNICKEKETKIRPQLEKLCYNVIVDTIGVPKEYVDFKFELKDNIDQTKSFHISPTMKGTDYTYNDMDEIHNEEDEIKKRKLVNLLTQGGATRLFNSIRDKYLSKVFDLDEDLPRLYSKVMKINDYILFSESVNIDDNHVHQEGYCEVVLGNSENKTKINVEATIFPVLVHEGFKGILELIGTHCLPINDRRLCKVVMDKADILKEEPLNMRLGPIVWDYIFYKVDSRLIPYMLNKFITIDTNKFIRYMDEIIYKTKTGAEIVNELKDITDYASEYEKFKDDLHRKKLNNDIITDNYYNR